MTGIRPLAFALLLLIAPAPAHAADVVYPTGSRIGLEPLPGFSQSRSFFGFEDASNSVAFVLVGLPSEAYGELERSLNAEGLRPQGLILEKREALTFPAGKGFLVIARQEVENVKLRKWIAVVAAPGMTALVTAQIPDAAKGIYPDATLRKTMATVAVRPSVPADEQLTLVPFKLSELAQFRVGGVLPGRAVLLTDGESDAPPPDGTPHMMISVAAGGPAQTGDRGAFAQDVFAAVPGVRDVHIQSSEPLRILGQPGYQIMANGKFGPSGVNVTIVQWIRFGSGAYLHLLGVAAAPQWTAAYARFRQVRDGVDVR